MTHTYYVKNGPTVTIILDERFKPTKDRIEGMRGKKFESHDILEFTAIETDDKNLAGNPDNYILAAHCGYFGVVPQSFATDWKVESKVLAIVDDNAIALDARLPEGPITLAKLHPTLETMSVIEGEIEKYTQYENSDCLNGAVIRVRDGHQLVSSLTSHHYLILTGHRLAEIRQIAKILNFDIEAY